MTRRKKAFTLIELLVVIAVIAVLMGILMPALQKARAQGQAAVCLNNCKQLGMAIHLYAEDYDRKIPQGEDNRGGILRVWPTLLMKYVGGRNAHTTQDWTDIKSYRCPSYPDKRQMVGYVTNGWDFKSPGNEVNMIHARGPYIHMDKIPRHATTVWFADYAHGHEANNIQIVERGVTDQDLFFKMRRMDNFENRHLPRYGLSTRRVARNRHGLFTNCAFIDGHSGKIKSLDMTAWDWGVSKDYVRKNPLPEPTDD